MSIAAAVEARHLSASTINDLMVCEKRWAYSRGIDPTVPQAVPNKWLVAGQLVHAMIRAHYDGLNPEAAYKEGLAFYESEGSDLSLATTACWPMFNAWKQSAIAGIWTPTEQEKEVRYEIAGHEILGYIDALDEKMIVDWKTSTRPWDAKKKKAARIQAAAYAIPTGIREVKFVVMTHGDDKYRVDVHATTVTDQDIARFEALVRVYGPRVQSTLIDDFAPNGHNEFFYLCNPKYCDFWKNCPAGQSMGGES